MISVKQYPKSITIYNYDGAKPHAVTEVENTAGLIDSNDHTIGYNGFGKISSINNPEYSMSFGYGPDRERWRVTTGMGVIVAPPAITDSLWLFGEYELQIVRGRFIFYTYIEI